MGDEKEGRGGDSSPAWCLSCHYQGELKAFASPIADRRLQCPRCSYQGIEQGVLGEDEDDYDEDPWVWINS